MAKKKAHRRRAPQQTPQQQLKRQLREFNWGLLLILAMNTIILFAVYRILVGLGYFVQVFTVYGLLTLGFLCGYVIYNRGLIPRSVKREQLPETWGEEQKDAFLLDAARRTRRSRWMLTIIFPLCITLAYEVIDVYILDVWRNL